MRLRLAVIFGAGALALAACQQPIDPQLAGVGAGAATGAAAGQLIGGDTRSTVLGAGIGGIGGGIVATEQQRIHQQRLEQQAQQPPIRPGNQVLIR
jgi:hypothetical protein